MGVCVSWPQRGSPSPGACWEHATHHARAYAPITRDANATIGTASHSGGTAIVVPPWQLCLGCVKQTAWCGHSRDVVRVFKLNPSFLPKTRQCSWRRARAHHTT